MITLIRTTDDDFERRFSRLVRRAPSAGAARITEEVKAILADVALRGDAALVELSAKFDQRPGMTIDQIEIERGTLDRAMAEVDPAIGAALSHAARRIEEFHAVQRAQILSAVLDDGRGIRAELIARPLDRVGVYVPGGTAVYPSTVLMNVIPAKVAGVREVLMVTPAKGGHVAPAVLAAALIAGADRVFSVGGAQSIAALAYGTQTIPRADKIVGPGNAYVQEAKRLVFGEVAIDQIAGPSEVLLIADGSASPRVLAADLLAQAEHDVQSAALLVTWSERVAEQTAWELEEQCATLPRAEIARQAIAARGGIVIARDKKEAFELANRYAPEHLGLAIEDAEVAVDLVRAAGAVFVGHHAPEALGDYNAGTNHVLPTGGTARFGSPLSVHDFVRRMSVLKVDPDALDRIGPDAVKLAREEGLEAHARAIEARWRSS